jgi:sperm-associated antigen 16 protein
MQKLLHSNMAALKPPEPDPCISRHPEVVDDYIRNFLIKMGMAKTLDTFETEWCSSGLACAIRICSLMLLVLIACATPQVAVRRYDLKAAGKLKAAATDRVPDAYMHNAKLSDEIISLRKQLDKANSIAEKASSTWDTFRKERDFHRMHHKRVVQVPLVHQVSHCVFAQPRTCW